MNKKNKTRLLKIALPLALVAGAVAIYVMFFGPPVYKNIESVRESSGLSVVLPTSLPVNSTIVTHPQFDETTGVISTVVNTKGTDVTFSQQKRPNVDLKQVDAEDTFLVDAGSVYILRGEQGRLQAIVETGDSWLIVNADAAIGNAAFKDLLESLGTI